MNIFDFVVADGNNAPHPLAQYRDKVLLIVNVASQCGFTPQYASLESLFKQYADQGLVVIAFPCNQFGNQEPGANAEIMEFCRVNYGVSFPVMAKLAVNGSASAPIYQFLKTNAPGLLGTKAIKWNFTKFLLGRDGQVIKRYAPTTVPEQIANDIEKALG
ncbi:MAG: glutathione peroxidase [Methylovulum sp.]|nr:glutathione peroxidase [Methylovulum sp.]